MAMQRSLYEYKCLDTEKRLIRLLTLHPRRLKSDPGSDLQEQLQLVQPHEEVIRCSFAVVSLLAPPPYEALSYVWGDHDDLVEIVLEGHVFKITKNLHSALRHLRCNDKERLLWVDALCINQEDDFERGNQISMMAYIFGGASRVLAYLGDAWDGSEKALAYIEQIGSDSTLHIDPEQYHHATVDGSSLYSEEVQNHVLRFFSTPWHNRTWTVQEYVLAKDVLFQCGNLTLKDELLRKFTKNIHKHYGRCCRVDWSLTLPLSMAFVNLNIAGRTVQALSDFLYLLVVFRPRQVCDSRDKVYGMLGLANGTTRARIRADYFMSRAEVFTRLTVEAVTQSGNLDILSCVYGRRLEEFELPSFVPDWTSQVSREQNLHFMGRYEQLEHRTFWASKWSWAKFKLIDGVAAEVQGITVDRIAEIETLADAVGPIQILTRTRLEIWQEMAHKASRDAISYPYPEEAFWKCMCGYVRGENQTAHSFSEWKAWLEVARPSKLGIGGQHDHEFQLSHENVKTGRKFFTTQYGLIGWAGTNSEVGDFVVVLSGGKVPYILRESHDEASSVTTQGLHNNPTTRKYQFVSDAFVQGVMFGEAYDESETVCMTLV